MKLKVLISEGEDGWLVVECPSIPGCISQGKTLEEALDNIKEAVEGCQKVIDPFYFLSLKRCGDLNIDRGSWFNIDNLLDPSLEEHGLRVIKLTIIDSNVMVLITNNTKAEPSVRGISTRTFSAD